MHFFLWTPMRFVNFHRVYCWAPMGLDGLKMPSKTSTSGKNLKNHLESKEKLPTLPSIIRKVWNGCEPSIVVTFQLQPVSNFHAYGKKSATFFQQNHFTLVTSLFLWVGGHFTYLWFRVTWTHHPKKGSQTQNCQEFQYGARDVFLFGIS